MRLSQHRHNGPRSPRAWGGGKVCRDNRRGRIFHRRQSQGCGGQTIGVWQSPSEAPRACGSWGAVRRAGQRDEGGRVVSAPRRRLAEKRRLTRLARPSQMSQMSLATGGFHLGRVAEPLRRPHTASGHGSARQSGDSTGLLSDGTWVRALVPCSRSLCCSEVRTTCRTVRRWSEIPLGSF